MGGTFFGILAIILGGYFGFTKAGASSFKDMSTGGKTLILSPLFLSILVRFSSSFQIMRSATTQTADFLNGVGLILFSTYSHCRLIFTV